MKLSGPVKVTLLQRKQQFIVLFSDIHWEQTYCVPCKHPTCLEFKTVMLTSDIPIFVELHDDNIRPMFDGLLGYAFDHRNQIKQFIPFDNREYKDMINVAEQIREAGGDALLFLQNNYLDFINGKQNVFGAPIKLKESLTSEQFVQLENIIVNNIISSHVDQAITEIFYDEGELIDAFYASIISSQTPDLSLINMIMSRNDPLVYVVAGIMHVDDIIQLLVNVMGYSVIENVGDNVEQCTDLTDTLTQIIQRGME